MKIQGIYFTNAGVTISYLEDSDVHMDSGLVTTRQTDVPHALIPEVFFEDLLDSVQQILDHALTIAREPADKYRAPR